MTRSPRCIPWRRWLAWPWWATWVAAAAADLSIPAFTAYTEPDANVPRISERGGVRGWSDPLQSVNWHGLFRSTGAVSARVSLSLPEGAESRLRLTVGERSREATARGGANGVPLELSFGDFDIARTGYTRFRLESLNPKGRPAGDVSTLHLSGPATEGAHFNLKERRNAASVHLSYVPPTTNKVPVHAFHCEVTAVEDPTTTFYMA